MHRNGLSVVVYWILRKVESRVLQDPFLNALALWLFSYLLRFGLLEVNQLFWVLVYSAKNRLRTLFLTEHWQETMAGR